MSANPRHRDENSFSTDNRAKDENYDVMKKRFSNRKSEHYCSKLQELCKTHLYLYFPMAVLQPKAPKGKILLFPFAFLELIQSKMSFLCPY